MTADPELAILFADVVGSTRLYDEFGDTMASDTVAQCLEIMREATLEAGGQVIKTIGDEILSTFESVDEAMEAAVMMQSGISSRGADQIPVSIRIGCHYGPVVRERNDIFGAAVHTANRMTSQAKSGQIVISGATVEEMGRAWRGQTRQIDVATVRGRVDEVALYELVWQPDEATSMLPTLQVDERAGRSSTLILLFNDCTLEVSDRHKSINLGRSEDNDVVLKGSLISRLHARIEKRRGKFYLVDQSTNGTFIIDDSNRESFVRREAAEIVGEGLIGLGRTVTTDSPGAIRFKVTD
jgi:class 3 adenylate cyclase